MRAKIASHCHGHAFEKRFIDLDFIQLSVLYRQALAEEAEERKEKRDTMRALNDAWLSNFDRWFRDLRIFVNPEFHAKLEDMDKLQEFRQEITAEEFPSEWEKLMKVIPRTYLVEEKKQAGANFFSEMDPEIEEVVAGWVPSRQFKKNGGDF